MAKNRKKAHRSKTRLQIDELGLATYLSFRIAKTQGKREIRPLKIGRYNVNVRTSTPDIKVAMASLKDEFDVLQGLLPQDFDGLIVDAGGYIGTAALKLSEFYPHAQVVSIEPSSDNFAVLSKNIADHNNISAIHAALVPSEQGKVTLNNRGTGEWGFTIVENPRDQDNAEELEEIDTVTLDDISARFPGKKIGLMKLDIEGGEKQLMDDAKDSLKAIDVLFVELHDRIVEGCSSSFQMLSKNRWVLKVGGEKFLSLSRSLSQSDS